MNLIEREMISQIASDAFAVAEREYWHMAHTRDLIHKMALEEFPMNREWRIAA
jgi:tyrosine-protein phosphatase YwqE